ncbi:MAG: TetR/AcrR family transcriptional regulator [Pseudomonadota bacterium]
MASALKQRVLDTADTLFYAEGVRAIGIDRIIAESGIAKASFYRFFVSKDALITEWIQMRDRAWRLWLEESVASLSPQAAGRPLAVFDALYARFCLPSFRGCAFTNTIIELSNSDHPGALAARQHKQQVVALLERYLSEAGQTSEVDIPALAADLMLLVDGALVTALREQKPDAALRAKRIAKLLLQTPG